MIAALRELMQLGPNDPAPVPPPLPAEQKDEKKTDRRTGKRRRRNERVICRLPRAALGRHGGCCLRRRGAHRRARPPSTAQPRCRPRRQRPTARPKPIAPWLNQYCVGCHNSRDGAARRRSGESRDRQPRRSAAERRDVGARAAQAERARDAAAGHAAPAGSRVRRRSRPGWPSSLDRAWAGKSTPGRYVVHRLNRTRIRQRDSRPARARRRRHRAAAERRRRLRLRQHRAVAEDVAAAARALSHRRAAHQHAGGRRPDGAARQRRSIRSAASSRQSGYIEGLPLGTRGGTRGPSRVPGRRRIQAVGPPGPRRRRRLRRRRGQRHAAHVRHHGRRRRGVSRPQIGGPKDHEVQAKDMNEAQRDHRRAHDRHASRSRPVRTTSASRGASGRPSGRTCGSPRCATARKST